MEKNTFYASIFNLLVGDTDMIIIKHKSDTATYKCIISIDRDNDRVMFAFSVADENGLYIPDKAWNTEAYPISINLTDSANNLLVAYINMFKNYTGMNISTSIKDEEVEEMF